MLIGGRGRKIRIRIAACDIFDVCAQVYIFVCAQIYSFCELLYSCPVELLNWRDMQVTYNLWRLTVEDGATRTL